MKDAGDAGAQAHIAALLDAHRPTDAVLSEEAKDSDARLRADRVWIIDPLDGTREYSEGRNDWAVHVALWQDGELRVGAVALGGPDVIVTTADDLPLLNPAERLRIAVSRSRPPALVESVAESLGAELVPMGSAGVKVCATVRGEVDLYVHGGGQFEWDSAAPIAIARSAGFHTSRLDGSAMLYNQPNPYLPDLVVCAPELAPRVLAAIADAMNSEREA
ncbi:3'(2'),5'-bisphosphate nucleotidase CysQ [Microbacterium sp. HD4P20]|uniref:3'(2'),5'-bisphosphate nucleotidase CysQ n=1 Tax=Microbacterium sp. HD4P20 TaxID=2864874 RepID=UPI0020A4FC15|nr:3'(2'),5'-bisphosphate nucleotidase CysQ [Microbacterium sp. HD4P20]MCP2638115.1 3'(2'),5'-bisphosphate nucleotidase CysQ [Microbacterium sp. HD4P20]